METSLNTIIGNAKRVIAYEIIKRLEEQKNTALLQELNNSVREKERKINDPLFLYTLLA